MLTLMTWEKVDSLTVLPLVMLVDDCLVELLDMQSPDYHHDINGLIINGLIIRFRPFIIVLINLIKNQLVLFHLID